jgi:biotin carboxylase
MRRALSEYIIRGIKTTIPFQHSIMHDPDFVRGKYDTSFVAKLIEARAGEFGGGQ